MLSNEQINSVIEKCKEKGYSVKVRDVAYILLCEAFEDKMVAYKCLFGDSGSVDEYESYDMVIELRNAISKLTKSYEDISFEENKAYMLKLKKETEEAIESKEIDKKDGLKILADLSTKLNDKFNVQQAEWQQQVHVSCKYNAICECGKEIYIPTKEDLMKKYNLIEA